MRLLTVAAGAVNQTPLDWDGNRDRIVAAIETARGAGAQLLCLPELAISGYGCEDAFHSASTHREAWRTLVEIVPATRRMAVAVGLPLFHDGALLNAVAMIVDGALAGFVAKQHLAGSGLHYEPRWFTAWPAGRQDGHASHPLGDVLFEIDGIRVGFEICEDAWVARRPGAELARRGVDVILNPSASHFAFGKGELRRRFVLEGSRAFSASYVYANLLGNEAGRAIYDGGGLIASEGHLLAAGEALGFDTVQVTHAQVDVEATRMARARGSAREPLAHDDGVVSVPFVFADESVAAPASVASEPDKEVAFTRAVALGLHDYRRKSGTRGFVVSLSGGADSAACAVLASLAIRWGGGEGTLTCLYQPTAVSSTTTREAARAVAEAVGARFHVLDVEPVVREYVRMVEEAVGRELSWERDDLALQNVQARARAPSAWLVANLEGALLLATSNRSEAAVGYTTMDGDTAGGLSPIAGIDKAFLRRWLGFMEREIPALAKVNALAPTAELRPPEAAQTDEDDLMPYDILDAVERAAIRDKLAPLEVYRVIRARFPDHDRHQLGAWVERFFRLWCRNQWKRERYAPSFHVDDENLDPKTWCRFPILSGGFERELAELARALEAER